MSKRHIIAVDPGDKNNGFCHFVYDSTSRTADLRIMSILGAKGLSDMLLMIWGVGQANPENKPKMFFVIENFRVDTMSRGAMFQWQEMHTSEMIGRVKLCAEWMGAPVFMQEPGNVLAQGRRWAPFPLPKGHIPDDKSAFIHGAFFMMEKKLINTVDQITFKGQGKMF